MYRIIMRKNRRWWEHPPGRGSGLIRRKDPQVKRETTGGGSTGMEIRKSKVEDLGRMMEIYEEARAFMASYGNREQWGDGYPKRDILEEDIALGRSYVVTEGERIVGTFAFFIGHDPVYDVITEGHWTEDRPYGVIHRVASCSEARGIGHACFEFCTKAADYVRIDTHEKNLPMQQALTRYGFHYCGKIRYPKNGERIAFDYIQNET